MNVAGNELILRGGEPQGDPLGDSPGGILRDDLGGSLLVLSSTIQYIRHSIYILYPPYISGIHFGIIAKGKITEGKIAKGNITKG